MAGRAGKKAKEKVAELLRMYVAAGNAKPSPPLGPFLGQVLYDSPCSISIYLC